MKSVGRRLFGFLGHAAAILAGLVLMLIGIGMGVTMFLIPLALPIGFVGLGMFLWGLLEGLERRKRAQG